MKKFAIAFLILSSVLINIPVSKAASEIELLVLAVENNNLKVVVGTNADNKLRIYDLYLSGDCSNDQFSIGDLIGVSANNPDYPSAGDQIVIRMSLSALGSNIEEDSLIEFDNCRILTAVYNSNDYYGIYGATNVGLQKYIFTDMQENYQFVDLASNCIDSNLSSDQIVIVKKNFADKLTPYDDVKYILKLTESDQLILLPIYNCALQSVTSASQTTIGISEIYPQYNLVQVYDQTTTKEWNLNLNSSCELFTGGSFNQYDFYAGYLYFTSNYVNKYDTPTYLEFNGSLSGDYSYRKIICTVEKSNLIETVVDKYDDSALYLPPEAFSLILPLYNYYERGNFATRIYTDRPDVEELIGQLVKGETDPATYTVDINGNLRWVKNEQVADRLYGADWDSQIIWFSDSIIYTYKFSDPILN